jgi:hypothetical protein
VSSRLLQRTLKKASLNPILQTSSLQTCKENLKMAYKQYYSLNGSHRVLRENAMEWLAEVIAEQGNQNKASIIKGIRQREKQRHTARKIRYLSWKVNNGSTTMVSVHNDLGQCIDLTNKEDIEQAIMKSNDTKYRQSSQTPFFQFPLASEFEFKGLTPAAQATLAGVYESNHPIDEYTQLVLTEMATPASVRELGPQRMEISKESYQNFWRKAKENTSCYPSAMSFSTMKAGATSDTISQLECNMTNIPLKTGYSPERWQKLMDIMILKRSGLTDLSSLRTIVLFLVDCNFAFKHIGREMMRIAEMTGSLAPEQYGSQKSHWAIDLATNKTLTNDLL